MTSTCQPCKTVYVASAPYGLSTATGRSRRSHWLAVDDWQSRENFPSYNRTFPFNEA
jgi:hypothetical protein